jgi:hypothetical protein
VEKREFHMYVRWGRETSQELRLEFSLPPAHFLTLRVQALKKYCQGRVARDKGSIGMVLLRAPNGLVSFQQAHAQAARQLSRLRVGKDTVTVTVPISIVL